ncbi:MAG: hypothetical protein ACE14S_04640 [Candidatus Bathyarchaeia archaeon]
MSFDVVFRDCQNLRDSFGKNETLEVNGKEILTTNVDGKFCAANDRCPYMNTRLSMGADYKES